MAGLIKKQILKILTKFTDGLQPDDIQEIGFQDFFDLKMSILVKNLNFG